MADEDRLFITFSKAAFFLCAHNYAAFKTHFADLIQLGFIFIAPFTINVGLWVLHGGRNPEPEPPGQHSGKWKKKHPFNRRKP